MIEGLIKNDLTLKRWRKFKSIRRSAVSCWVFAFLIVLSISAEFWANSKPIYLNFAGKSYVPIYFDYHPSEFKQSGVVTDYRALDLSNEFVIWPLIEWDPYESNVEVESYPSYPNKINLMGTDDRGRDVMARLIYGFRYSIGFSVMVWFFTYIVGTTLGAIMGFMGGRIDLFGQRVLEVFETMPIFLLLITLISIFGASMSLLVVFSTIFGWMLISIYIRAEFLKLRNREYVESARAQGMSRWRVMFKHILPNSLSPIVTFSPFTIAAGISSLAALDYLGFGLPPPTPSWGELLQQSRSYFSVAWWLGAWPSAAIFVTLLALNFIGEGVREAFDPRK